MCLTVAKMSLWDTIRHSDMYLSKLAIREAPMKKVFGRLSSGFRAAHRTYKSCLNFFINEFDPPGHPPFIKLIKNILFFKRASLSHYFYPTTSFQKNSHHLVCCISAPLSYIFFGPHYKKQNFGTFIR